ncbi:cyclophilin [Rhodovibrio sodomensis]|uniref:Peptidyl-prolyl cis-trans isomerase n=1 Tax=Rhodovibrio sodomensis TaxID=1088 RepID=A0ABS1DE25_9PROT|nr:cyclophilin [Rhodovibrio sodomensis]
MVRLETNRGDIRIELFAERAPQSVENFLAYVRTDHYDGTIFHRVIPDFMIQGGGFTPDYTRKPTRDPIRNEADNGLSNDRGTVAMARTGQPHSATAQFFINLSDNEFLDHTAKTQRGWGYAVFGEVISGLGTVDEIGQVPTGSAGPFAKDAPQQPVVIQDVVVE